MIVYHDQIRFIPGMWVWFFTLKSASVSYYMNSLENRNHTITSIDAEEPSTKFKEWKKIETEGAYLSTIKTESNKTVARKHSQWGKPQSVISKAWSEASCSLSSYSITDDKILYLKDSKAITRKFSDLMNTCSNVAGHNYNIQNQHVLYANNEWIKKEIRGENAMHSSLNNP